MSQLIQLKQRIKAISAIKKITQTMRLISMSTHSKLKKQSEAFESLRTEFKPLLCAMSAESSQLQQSNLVKKYKNLYVIFASEKGLCGTFNTTMFNFFNSQLTPAALENSHVIAIGKKASQYLVQHNIKPLAEFDKVLPNKLEKVGHDLYDKIVEIHHDYENVICFSSFAKTFFVQEARATTLIPIKTDPCNVQNSNINLNDYDWPQDKESVTKSLFFMLLKINILSLLINSMLSEQSARFLSMDNATRSAENLQKSMKLAFNKMRQAKITRELIELISGF